MFKKIALGLCVLATLGVAATGCSVQTSDSVDGPEARPTPTTSVGGPVSDDPPPPPPPNGSTQSFLTSTPNWTIKPDSHAHTFAESCPAGWYVRPGQGSAQSPTSINPAYIEIKSSRYIDSEGDSLTNPINPKVPWGISAGFKAKFTNTGLDSPHEVQLQYWCDKIPDWYSTTSAAKPPARTPLGIAKRSGTAKSADADSTNGRKGGIGPVPYGCFYCSFDFKSLTNAATGLALDSSNADSQGPLIVQTPGGSSQQWYALGQPGGGTTKNNIATFGFWRYRSILDYAITESSDGTVSFTDASSGEPPTNGDWYFVDHGAGSAINAVQLINTATGHCLASSGPAGSTVTATTCDATQKSQYWVQPAQ